MKLPPEVSDTVTGAGERARASGRSFATVYDLLAVLLEIPDLAEIIRQSGGDLRTLATGLSAGAQTESQPGPLARIWLALTGPRGGDFLLRRTVATAVTQRRLVSKPVRAADLLVAACSQRNRALAGLLQQAGVSRLRLLRWLCHGEPAGSPAPAPEGEYLEVVVLNDDYTHMQTVLRILQKVFCMTPGTAFKKMMTVHREGSAVAGSFPRDEAVRLAGEAARLAEGAEVPLKLILRRGPAPA